MIISYEPQMGKFGIIEPTSSEGISIGFNGGRFVIFKGDTPTMWSKYLINNNIGEDATKAILERIADETFYDLRGIVFVYNKTQTIDIALDLFSVNAHLQAQNKDNIIPALCGDTASIQLNNRIKRSSLDLDLDWGDLSDFN